MVKITIFDAMLYLIFVVERIRRNALVKARLQFPNVTSILHFVEFLIELYAFEMQKPCFRFRK